MSTPNPPFQVWHRLTRGDDAWQKLGATHADLTSAMQAIQQHQLLAGVSEGQYTYNILPEVQNPNRADSQSPFRRRF